MENFDFKFLYEEPVTVEWTGIEKRIGGILVQPFSYSRKGDTCIGFALRSEKMDWFVSVFNPYRPEEKFTLKVFAGIKYLYNKLY